MTHFLSSKTYFSVKLRRLPSEEFNTAKSECVSVIHTYPAHESTEVTRSESIVRSGKDGDGDDYVAEDAAQVVKGVHSDCERWRERRHRCGCGALG